MVCGWVYNSDHVSAKYFYLTEDRQTVNTDVPEFPYVRILNYLPFFDAVFIDEDLLQAKLDTSDLTKKCFIKGTLCLEEIITKGCCRATPAIVIRDINDIYFE